MIRRPHVRAYRMIKSQKSCLIDRLNPISNSNVKLTVRAQNGLRPDILVGGRLSTPKCMKSYWHGTDP